MKISHFPSFFHYPINQCLIVVIQYTHQLLDEEADLLKMIIAMQYYCSKASKTQELPFILWNLISVCF